MNDDLISRQDVLDSFKRICDNYCEDKKHGLAMCRACYLDDAIVIVENFPSEPLPCSRWKGGVNTEFITNTYSAAISKYGEKAQQMMAIEEMSELTKAICKYWRYPTPETVTDILEEMADVEIMLEQLKLMFGDPKEVKETKIHRLFRRVREDEVVVSGVGNLKK